MDLHDPYMFMGWVVVGWGVVGWGVVGWVIRLSFQSNSNSQKLSLWCKKNLYPPRWICMTHIWFPTEFPRGINKIHFFDEISTSGKKLSI